MGVNKFVKIDIKTQEMEIVTLTDEHKKGVAWQCEQLNKIFKNIATFKIFEEGGIHEN